MDELEGVALSLEMCQGANRTGIPPDFEHKIQAGNRQRFTRIFESDHDASFRKLGSAVLRIFFCLETCGIRGTPLEAILYGENAKNNVF